MKYIQRMFVSPFFSLLRGKYVVWFMIMGIDGN